MAVRPYIAAALCVAAVAAPASAHGTVALDGRRHNHVRMNGSLTDLPLRDPSARMSRSDALTPTRSDCTATSCDTTTLQLTLPKGSLAGWFTLTVDVDVSLDALVVIYDGRGRELSSMEPTGSGAMTFNVPTRYSMTYRQPRLKAGTYQVVIFNNGGRGTFTLDVVYDARPTPKAA